MIRSPRHSATPDRGFTLIEVLVVVMIVGLGIAIVVPNLGAMIPDSSMDSQANQLRTWIDFLRSESKVQGKPYTLELDLDNNRTRLVLPQEDKLVTTEEDTLASTIPMDWTPLDRFVRFAGHAVAGREIYSKGTIEVTFDENGFAADQSIYLGYGDEDPKKMIWTIHIQGLSGSTSVYRSMEGEFQPFPKTEESSF